MMLVVTLLLLLLLLLPPQLARNNDDTLDRSQRRDRERERESPGDIINWIALTFKIHNQFMESGESG